MYAVILTCSARFFYWDTATDNVSWLSPKHPKAIIGKAASEIRAKLREESKTQVTSNSKDSKDDFAKPYSRESSYDYSRRRKPMKDLRKKKARDDELDPMDPASYSDIPR